jgi:hypothetical protein
MTMLNNPHRLPAGASVLDDILAVGLSGPVVRIVNKSRVGDDTAIAARPHEKGKCLDQRFLIRGADDTVFPTENSVTVGVCLVTSVSSMRVDTTRETEWLSPGRWA